MKPYRKLSMLLVVCGILAIPSVWWLWPRNDLSIRPVLPENHIKVAEDSSPQVFTVNSAIDEIRWGEDSTSLSLLTKTTDDSGPETRTLSTFSLDDNNVVELFRTREVCLGLASSPDGATLYTALWRTGPGGECQILGIDRGTGKERVRIDGFPLEGLGVAFTSDPLTVSVSPDGRYLAAGTKLVDDEVLAGGHIGGEVCVWDLESNAPLWNRRDTHTDIVQSVAFSPDSGLLASAGGDKLIRLWNVSTGELKQTLVGTAWHGISSVAFSPDARRLATGGQGDEDGGVVRIWDIENSRLLHRIAAFRERSLVRVVFARDGRLFGVGPKRGTDANEFRVHVWNSETGDHLGILAEGTGAARAIALSPNEQHVAVGTYDGNLFVINVNDSGGLTRR